MRIWLFLGGDQKNIKWVENTGKLYEWFSKENELFTLSAYIQGVLFTTLRKN